MPDALPEIKGKTIKRARLMCEHGSQSGPEPSLELWFTDGTYFALSFQTAVPDATVLFSAGDDDSDVRKIKLERAR
jgi:hypothetical protein